MFPTREAHPQAQARWVRGCQEDVLQDWAGKQLLSAEPVQGRPQARVISSCCGQEQEEGWDRTSTALQKVPYPGTC